MAKAPWDHFAKRAAEERLVAARAALPEIAETHLQLSRYYDDMVKRHEEDPEGPMARTKEGNGAHEAFGRDSQSGMRDSRIAHSALILRRGIVSAQGRMPFLRTMLHPARRTAKSPKSLISIVEQSGISAVPVLPKKECDMAEYREDSDGTIHRRGGSGRIIAVVILLAAVIVAILFATGFWSADVKEGSLPDVEVSAKGGSLPAVDVDSKELVVGTKETNVDVPKIETKKTQIDVPVIGVKDDGKKD